MKHISFQCLPKTYLVPKKFHCGLLNIGNLDLAKFKQPIVPNCNNTLAFDGEKWLSYNRDEAINKSQEVDTMFKKYSTKKDVTASEKHCLPVNVVCKSRQSEKITQFQLITSNTLENYKNKVCDLKWCPIDFYECPTQQFRRNKYVSVTYKEPNLRRLLIGDNDPIKKVKSLSVTSLNIDYEVTCNTNDFIEIKSTIDLNANKAFLHLLESNDNEPVWEDILKLIESQLGQDIKKIHVQLEMDLKKK